MVERQPGRPDKSLFIGAARRFLKGDYTSEVVPHSHTYYAKPTTVYPGKNLDEYLIRQEWAADGLLGTYESLADFALRQLLAYEKQQRH